MNLRSALLIPLCLALAACVSLPSPGVPVPAGDGFVWVLKDGGRSALWGPPASEAVFAVACDAAGGRVEFRHYGLARPDEAAALRIRADGQAKDYPVQVRSLELGDYLLASTSVADPFLDRMRGAAHWEVHAGGQTLRVGASAAPPAAVLGNCGA